MKYDLNRKGIVDYDIYSSSTTANSPSASAPPERTLRIGFVGVGNRGSYHLDCALGIEGVEVPAVCEVKEDRLERAKNWVEEAGQPTPRLYGRSETDFKRMCETEDLDVIICCTSWESARGKSGSDKARLIPDLPEMPSIDR